jgi:stress-induced-phosphoprotein 1
MRDYTKAIEAAQEAKDRDPEHKHAREIAEQEMKCQQALFSQRGTETQEQTLERAMRDPEVAVCVFFTFSLTPLFINVSINRES